MAAAGLARIKDAKASAAELWTRERARSRFGSTACKWLVGRSGAQNDAALRLADADDVWLHARNVPGAHTVLRSGGRDVPDEIINQAAQIAAYYSKLRESTSAEVDVTRRRYVRRIPGAHPGLVTYRNEYTIRVQADAHTAKRIVTA